MIEREPPYDKLIEMLRKDWQIDVSWDGLRRFWYIGWTEEHVAQCKECAEGLGAYADSLCDPLKAENDKLRELADDAYSFAFNCYHGVFDQEAFFRLREKYRDI